jgi:Methylpurine-DNA glycosylase (MPG)
MAKEQGLGIREQGRAKKDASGARIGTVAPGRLVPRSFFARPSELVAPELLGKLLVHRTQYGVMAGRIVEVEAYLGPHNNPPDPAAHSYRGPTPRNQVLFGPAGHAYVYSIYGMYFCMNITCEDEGLAGCARWNQWPARISWRRIVDWRPAPRTAC